MKYLKIRSWNTPIRFLVIFVIFLFFYFFASFSFSFSFFSLFERRLEVQIFVSEKLFKVGILGEILFFYDFSLIFFSQIVVIEVCVL